MKKRLLALLLAICVLTGMLAGCGGQGGSTGETEGTPAASGDQVQATDPTEEALPRKLTIGIAADSLVTDYDDNHLTNLLEETLNCELEFVLLPSDSGELNTKLGLMVNSPDQLPDVIIASLDSAAVYEYGSKGAFLDLSSYVNEEDMPNFFNIPEADRELMRMSMVSADGGMYGLVRYEPQVWNMSNSRMWINKAWLDNLELDIPTTTEQLYEVLKAFKTQDPNGNGIADELGAYGNTSLYGANLAAALMNSFTYFNWSDLLALDETGENVIAPFITDEYKEGLKYLNKLYSEGLIDPGLFTDTQDQMKVYQNSETQVLGFLAVGSHGGWTDAKTNPNFLEMELIAPLEGPTGVAYTPYTSQDPVPIYFVTSQCENVELAIEMGDLFYEASVGITARYGQEGVDWTTDPDVMAQYTHATIEAGVYDREDAAFALYHNIWPEQTNHYWKNINPRYAPAGFFSVTVSEDTKVGNFVMAPTKQAEINHISLYHGKWPEHILPVLKYTADEQEIRDEVRNLVKGYVRETLAQFVTGALDIDKDWDAYVKELEKMGLQDWIDVAQTAYDRVK